MLQNNVAVLLGHVLKELKPVSKVLVVIVSGNPYHKGFEIPVPCRGLCFPAGLEAIVVAAAEQQ